MLKKSLLVLMVALASAQLMSQTVTITESAGWLALLPPDLRAQPLPVPVEAAETGVDSGSTVF